MKMYNLSISILLVSICGNPGYGTDSKQRKSKAKNKGIYSAHSERTHAVKGFMTENTFQDQITYPSYCR